MSEIPDGYYAVPDPDKPDQLTLWRAADGRIEPSPNAAIYGPVLLKRDVPAGLPKPERARWIANWFETVQRPWRQAVRAAIAADPEAAGARYAEIAIRCRSCGPRLTDAVSKAAGRGPDCRGDRGAA